MTNRNISYLQELREKKGYSYEDMSKKLGISKAYYWQLEHKNRRLYYELAKNIAAVFELRPDDIFFDEYSEKTPH